MSLGHVVVIGGGIAGASAAYFLSCQGVADRITLVEAEAQLAHHTTGRSAALLTENYGAGPIRPLTTASLAFLHSPPAHLVEQPILTARGIMTVAVDQSQHDELDRQLEQGANTRHPVVEISITDAAAHAPHIVFGPDSRVMFESQAHDIDVAALHQIYVRGFRANGGEIETSRRVDAASRASGGWLIDTTAGSMTADLVVNAAGAWGDKVAVTAGVNPVGLAPLRRTAFMVTSPFEDSSAYAFVASADHSWYLRPDGHQFMCSPADETPSEPCDARPLEIDIAMAIDQINANTTLSIRSINSSWAGLRTFAPDRSMVIGPDPIHADFVWCVGQGGTGIQTSPGVGRLVADLVAYGRAGSDFDGTGLDLKAVGPDRFARAT